MGRFLSGKEIDIYYSHADTSYDKAVRARNRERIDRMNAYRQLDEDQARERRERRHKAADVGAAVGRGTYWSVIFLLVFLLAWQTVLQTVFYVVQNGSAVSRYLDGDGAADEWQFREFSAASYNSPSQGDIPLFDTVSGAFVDSQGNEKTVSAGFYKPRYFSIGSVFQEFYDMTVDGNGDPVTPLAIAWNWFAGLWQYAFGQMSTMGVVVDPFPYAQTEAPVVTVGG